MHISSSYSNTENNNSSKTKNENETSNNTSFEKNMNETQNKEDTVEVKQSTQELIDDIMSLFRTGMTVSELEKLQELLKEIKDKIKNEDLSEEEIEKMLSEVEKQILAFKKSITGVAIKEAEQTLSASDNSKNLDKNTLSIEQRIEDASASINELKNGNVKKTNPLSNHDELELLQMIKEFKK